MDRDRTGRTTGFRWTLAACIVLAAAVVVLGTVHVLSGGAHPVNVALIVVTSAIGLAMLVWAALRLPNP